ncbi:MAG TPA: hemerythrin domain-containing protein [Flavisolibacter sp.]
MTKEIKPIKRSRQLTPLSKDHHEGLLLVWKIRQGLRNQTEKQLIADYIKWFWKKDLEEHFREEEEILAPYLKGNDMIKRMFDEHAVIQSLINSNDLSDEKQLNRLADLVNDHIRFEERELFPLAEKLIPEEDLDKIESQLKKEPKQMEPWGNQFWLNK